MDQPLADFDPSTAHFDSFGARSDQSGVVDIVLAIDRRTTSGLVHPESTPLGSSY